MNLDVVHGYFRFNVGMYRALCYIVGHMAGRIFFCFFRGDVRKHHVTTISSSLRPTPSFAHL